MNIIRGFFSSIWEQLKQWASRLSLSRKKPPLTPSTSPKEDPLPPRKRPSLSPEGSLREARGTLRKAIEKLTRYENSTLLTKSIQDKVSTIIKETKPLLNPPPNLTTTTSTLKLKTADANRLIEKIESLGELKKAMAKLASYKQRKDLSIDKQREIEAQLLLANLMIEKDQATEGTILTVNYLIEQIETELKKKKQISSEPPTPPQTAQFVTIPPASEPSAPAELPPLSSYELSGLSENNQKIITEYHSYVEKVSRRWTDAKQVIQLRKAIPLLAEGLTILSHTENERIQQTTEHLQERLKEFNQDDTTNAFGLLNAIASLESRIDEYKRSDAPQNR